LAALTALGFASSTDTSFVRQVTHQAGFGGAIIPLLTAFGTYHLAAVRKKVMSAVINHFEGTRLATWISCAEDFWVIFAVIFMFLFAVLGLILIAGTIALLLIVRKRWEIAEEHRKIACGKCGKMIYPCAIACGSCGQTIGTPMAIGFLGQSKPFLTQDVPHHPYRLMEKRRCPICAAHLPIGRPFEPCRNCGKATTANPEFVQTYSNYVGRRLAPVLAVCAAIGAVPFVGMIVGTVYYELVLVVPYSQYLPMGRRFLLRWELRILFFILAMLQIVPVVGIVSVPLAAWISFAAYQRSYRDAMLARAGLAISAGIPAA
jgi:hypothetical protein